MAVFSNDPRAQSLWDQIQGLNLITASPCPDTRQIITDLCNNDPDKLSRFGYAGCRKVETVKNDCQDYNRNVKAKAETSAELEKYLKDTAKAKADAENKAADLAAEQAILARRRASNTALENARRDACSYIADPTVIMNKPQKEATAIQEGCFKASNDYENNRTFESTRVTFDEVARERGQSSATGARAAPGVARALAQPARTPKPRLPRPKPAPEYLEGLYSGLNEFLLHSQDDPKHSSAVIDRVETSLKELPCFYSLIPLFQ